MLTDVLRAGAEALLDDNQGINAYIAVINRQQETRGAHIQTFEFDRYPLPTEFARTPALVQTVATGRPGPKQQSKRNSRWRIEWHWWDNGTAPDYAQVATVVDAMAYVAEHMICKRTVINVDEMEMQVGGFEGRDRFWTHLRFGFQVHERDEGAEIQS